MTRCFDCLEIIKPGDRWFLVLMGDPNAGSVVVVTEMGWGRCRVVRQHVRQECVCADCVGWYRDAVEMTET